jgi:hypothetical protein
MHYCAGPGVFVKYSDAAPARQVRQTSQKAVPLTDKALAKARQNSDLSAYGGGRRWCSQRLRDRVRIFDA